MVHKPLGAWGVALVISGALGLAGFAAPVSANPFSGGDAAQGKKLHDAKCAACHNTMFPDKDGTQLYSDLFRKSETPAAMKGMVTMCANRSGAGWFDEEILHVARYLNDTYYKFK
jgi:mono/diheme cytochrome c family protein